MESVFFEVTVIITIACILSILFRFLKQPPILAYVLAGIILGPLGLVTLHHTDVLRALGEFGITFLLFVLGLELKFSDIKSIGKISAIVGIGQMIGTGVLAFFISRAVGFDVVPAIYIGIALSFSSTIVIVKLLSDKRDLNSLYGKIAVGVLLIQDIIAIMILVVLSGFSTSQGGGFEVVPFLLTLLKGVFVGAIVIGLSKTVIPKIIEFTSHNSEVLFLTSLAWVFCIAVFVSSPWIGFSKEIGGLLAGIALANSTQHFQIVARVRVLRDFFITIFFIMLGMDMVFENVLQILPIALLLSAFVIFGKPLIVLGLMGFSGFKRRTAFLVGLTVSQISEFSLIVVFLGNQLGHIQDNVAATITVIAVITFTISTYAILNGNKIYKQVYPYLKYFEKKETSEQTGLVDPELKNHVILIGANRFGANIVDALEDSKQPFLVVDFNPEVVENLKERNIPVLFGDMSDPDIQELAQLRSAKLVISTAPDIHDTAILLEALRNKNKRAKSIVSALYPEDAKILYRKGADYVVIPHFSGGLHISEILQENKIGKLESLKNKSLSFL